MKKKITLLLVALSAILVVSASYFVNIERLTQLANHFLAPDFQLELAEQTNLHWQGAEMPQLRLHSMQNNCDLVTLDNLRLDNWYRQIHVDKAVIDYACLTSLPTTNNTSSSFNLAETLALVPNFDLQVAQFQFSHLESLKDEQLESLLALPTAVQLQQKDGKIQFHSQTLAQTGGQFLASFLLDGLKLTGDMSLHNKEQNYQLNLNTELDTQLENIPKQGNVQLHWQDPSQVIPQAMLNLSWLDQQGHLTLVDDNKQTSAEIPFQFNQQKIQIQQGKLFWQATDELPLTLLMDLSLTKKGDGWFPLIPDLHLKLIWPGIRDNLSIASRGGEIDEEHFDLPLEAHGNIKYDDTVVYNDLLFTIGGNYSDPKVEFLAGSALHVLKKSEGSNILINVPLEKVIVSQYGVNGRLQAHLEGKTPQFDQLDLKLDGQANEFIAGIKSIFSLSDDESLNLNPQMAKNLWQWTFSGTGKSLLLQTPFHFFGEGEWHNNHILIQQLDANTDRVELAGIRIPKIELKQLGQTNWNYEQQKIEGKMSVSAPEIAFSYGGELIKPAILLQLTGQGLSDFNVQGNLSAGLLGPINLSSYYKNQIFAGTLDWAPQSAKVFQSLFPAKWQMLIQQGRIEGHSQFKLDKQGFNANGNIQIVDSRVLLPDIEINGIQIKLPYQFINNGFELNKKPIQVLIKQIKNGELNLDNLSVKVNGYFPYDKKKPLRLSELSVDLLGGNLSVNKFALPQTKIANVQLANIDLAQVLNLAQYTQVEMKGRVNAIFPFWLEHHECLICNGEIAQVNDVQLRISEKMAQGLKQGGLTESILLNLVNAVDFQQLKAHINLAPSGLMQLSAKLTGHNPNKTQSGPVTLNYQHQENLFDLWQLIDYDSQFEQKLQHNLYQQLEQYEKAH